MFKYFAFWKVLPVLLGDIQDKSLTYVTWICIMLVIKKKIKNSIYHISALQFLFDGKSNAFKMLLKLDISDCNINGQERKRQETDIILICLIAGYW